MRGNLLASLCLYSESIRSQLWPQSCDSQQVILRKDRILLIDTAGVQNLFKKYCIIKKITTTIYRTSRKLSSNRIII